MGNKADNLHLVHNTKEKEWKFFDLPYPLPVSAILGSGIGDLLDVIYKKLIEIGLPPQDLTIFKPCRVAVIGKPNVGKSSLLNTILGEERFITSPIAHTTREPNDTMIEVKGKNYLLVDTAGIRKQNKIRRGDDLERAGVERTRRVLKKTDIALLVIDINGDLGIQEKVLAGLLQEARVGVIIVANKWDLIPEKTPKTMAVAQPYI